MADRIAEEAVRRHNLHRHHTSSRPLSDNYELVGLRGEEKLGEVLGIDVDLSRRPGGDGGVDFVVPIIDPRSSRVMEWRVDVKTARKPGNLIVERGKVRLRTIYVLARYSDATDSVDLLGWECSAVVARAPVRDFGYGIINHYIPASMLRSVADLIARVAT